MGCEIEPASYVRSQSGETFTCLADFDTASPLFQPGQKAEIVVETIPYGYTYSRQNAVESVLAEQTFNYTGTPQEFTATVTGNYLIEAMGASGSRRRMDGRICGHKSLFSSD